MVEDIYQAAGAAVRVLNDALNLQKLQSGAFEFVHKPFVLDDLVVSTMRMAQPQMKSKNIEVCARLCTCCALCFFFVFCVLYSLFAAVAFQFLQALARWWLVAFCFAH